MTPKRTRALNAKKKFDRLMLDLSRYASGNELAVALASGKAKLRAIAREHLVSRYANAMQLSDRHLHVLELVTFTQFVWKRDGLIVPHVRLGELLGLKARRTGSVVRELVAWGYLLRHETFRPYGEVTSQRANAYELAPAARACIERRHAQPGNEVSSSGVPANPETPCSQILEEHVSLSGDCVAVPEKVSAPREPRGRTQIDFTSVAAGAGPLPFQPARRQDATRGSSGRLGAPGGADELVRDVGPYLDLLADLANRDRGGAS